MSRLRQLNEHEYKSGSVIYWMSRDQRIEDNWGIIYAQDLALKLKQEFRIVFCLTPTFLGATMRAYDFMLKGLEEVEEKANKYNIPFDVIIGSPEKEIESYSKKHNGGIIITDFDPLKIKRKWKKEIMKKIKVPFCEVDAHNIIPCWLASDKEEFAAYTFRPKVNKKLGSYLTGFEKIHKLKTKVINKNNWKKIYASIKADEKVAPTKYFIPGEKAGKKMLKSFIKDRLSNYSAQRNDPNVDALSNLSPYLHFGQISAHRVALEVQNSNAPKKDKEDFLEELIVRRELTDNFCYYNENYDNEKGFRDWAKKSLEIHKDDKREYIYTKSQFEKAKTHDPLWNACQLEMVKKGKMHSYLRMYWAKKILEWTPLPKEAQKIAIYLNDKYELDGRDPNGYVGIAWSIGGVHDRAWFDRKVFGKIRYMNYNGAKKKFDIEKYIDYVNKL